MDKTGVDLGMRSGMLCPDCVSHFNEEKHPAAVHAIFNQVQTVLADIAIASRGALDICSFWSLNSTEEHFDVFLCHNSADKETIRQMNKRLQSDTIRTWLDEEQLPPGRLWQELLEEQIQQIKTVAVFVGESGLGPWQDIELRAFLNEFVKRRCPVIPVILPECSLVPQLPLFLKQFSWVDFRKKYPDPYSQLLWGITGKKRR